MKVDAGWGHDDAFAAMGFDVGTLAVYALGTGGVGNLLMPTDEGLQRGVELFRREMGCVAGRDDLALRIAVIGFDAPADGGFVDLGNVVQIVEEPRGWFDEDQQQAAGEGIERAAVADS